MPAKRNPVKAQKVGDDETNSAEEYSSDVSSKQINFQDKSKSKVVTDGTRLLEDDESEQSDLEEDIEDDNTLDEDLESEDLGDEDEAVDEEVDDKIGKESDENQLASEDEESASEVEADDEESQDDQGSRRKTFVVKPVGRVAKVKATALAKKKLPVNKVKSKPSEIVSQQIQDIVTIIQDLGNPKSGVSFVAIKKYLQQEKSYSDRKMKTVKVHLDKAIADGVIIRLKGVGLTGSFKLPKLAKGRKVEKKQIAEKDEPKVNETFTMVQIKSLKQSKTAAGKAPNAKPKITSAASKLQKPKVMAAKSSKSPKRGILKSVKSPISKQRKVSAPSTAESDTDESSKISNTKQVKAPAKKVNSAGSKVSVAKASKLAANVAKSPARSASGKVSNTSVKASAKSPGKVTMTKAAPKKGKGVKKN